MNNLYTAVTKKDGNWWIRKFKNYFKRGFRIQYEIRDILATKICKDLGITRIK